MKTFVLIATFVALGPGAAFAFGPSPSDAHPPGALKYSTPKGYETPSAPAAGELTGAPVRLRTHQPMHHRRAPAR